MKKAIITGPTGAVGVSLIHELLAHDVEVTAVCREGSARMDALPRHERLNVVACNLDEIERLSEVLPHDYDVFYHLAWDGTYGEARLDTLRQAGNVLYSLRAVRTAKQLGCSIFVGAGSQSEFGHVDGVMHPDTPCFPDNPYGCSKLAASQLSRLECRKLGIKHIWCRICSIYGCYDGKNTLVMSSILKMLRGERMQFTPGDQIWDYLYNKDCARAFRLVAERGRDGAIYCIGSGKTRRLKDFILSIRDAIDPKLEIGIGELAYYPNQVMHLEADIANLTADTGFTPQYSFEDGIRETIEWAKEQTKNHG